MTVGLHVQKGQMAEQDYLADAEHTSHAALVCEAIDRLLNRMLARQEPYRKLGANYFDAHRRAHLVDQLMRRIERIGYYVPREPVVAA